MTKEETASYDMMNQKSTFKFPINEIKFQK
jgi:hypothetical protein